MSLTGAPFLALLLFITVVLLVGVYLLWPRWPRRLIVAGRVMSLLLVMLLGALVAGDLLNRTYNFYSSFSDLLGQPPSVRAYIPHDVPRPAAHVAFRDPQWASAGERAARAHRGSILKVSLPGARSGINRDAEIYLPAAYFDTNNRGLSFPALEVLPGFPGHPHDYHNLQIAQQLDTEIAHRRIPPLVAVIPRTYEGASTECVDGVDGERDETYLAQDVYDDVVNSLRVQNGRTWATLGVSTGGFCAANLAIHNPDRYAAAASLSGYFTAGEDPGTGRLYSRNGKYSREANSPLWWVMHRNPVAPPLYLFASAGDPSAVQEAKRMAAAIHQHAPGLPSAYALLPSGGHNWGTWSVAFAPAVDWLAQYLPAPLADPQTLPSGTT